MFDLWKAALLREQVQALKKTVELNEITIEHFRSTIATQTRTIFQQEEQIANLKKTLSFCEQQNREFGLKIVTLRFVARRWRREALAYFGRLKPFLGQQEPVQTERDKALFEAREIVGATITKMATTNLGRDENLEKHLWTWAEAELALRGPEKAREIAQDIIDGETE